MEKGEKIKLRKILVNYLEDNAAEVQKHLKVGPGLEQEFAVHQMRVATKKIRSVARVVAHLKPAEFPQKKEIKKLRLLFRFAGILRELQVDQKVLKQYEEAHLAVYKDLSNLLNEEEKYASKLYEAAKKDFKLKNLHRPVAKAQALIKSLSKKDLLDGMRSMTAMRLKAIQQIMPDDYDRILIHKARILLKEAMYLMGLLHLGGDLESFPLQHLEDAKTASDIAGDWHDRETFTQWLRIQMRPGGPISTTAPEYRLLQQDVHTQTRALAEEFRSSLSKVVDFSRPKNDLVGNSGENRGEAEESLGEY